MEKIKKIHVEIKGIKKSMLERKKIMYEFYAGEILDKIFESCEDVKKLFPEKPYYGDPGHYVIMHKNPHLSEAMSQIDKFRGNSVGKEYDTLTYDYANSFWHLFRISMGKKKNIDVIIEYGDSRNPLSKLL